jgi:hypothetical protein
MALPLELGNRTQGILAKEQQPWHQENSALSPRENYHQLSAAVTQALREAGMQRSALIGDTPPLQRAQPISQTPEGPADRVKSVAAGAAITTVAYRVFSPSPPVVLRCSGPDRTTASGLIITTRASIAGALVAGLATAIATVSYQQLAKELREAIGMAYTSIGDDAITQSALLQSTNEIVTKKEGSHFNKIFEYYNPNEIGYLLLTKGIALDSQEEFLNAQQQYQMALPNVTIPELKSALHLAFARSLRLCGAALPAIEQQLHQIAENSPLAQIARIEIEAFEKGSDEVMDQDLIPFKFKCPITTNVMMEPAFYEKAEGKKIYFERAAIVQWLVRSPTCPISRAPLALHQLRSDEALVRTIQNWSQTKLKTPLI